MDDSILTELPTLPDRNALTGSPEDAAQDGQSKSRASTVIESESAPARDVDTNTDIHGSSSPGEDHDDQDGWDDINLAPTSEENLAAIRELAGRATESYLSTDPTSTTARHDDRELSNDIPRLLNACVEALGHSTGAYIDAKAIWYDPNSPDTARGYSTLSPSAKHTVSLEESKDEMGYFADRVFESAGPFFARDSFNAYPTVYSTPSAFGRPMLPPPHPNPQQRAITLKRWFEVLREWQGLPPISWEEVSRAIKSPATCPFSFSRTPGGLPWELSIDLWEVSQIDRMYGYIRSHQMRLMKADPYAEETAFQWTESNEAESFRKVGVSSLTQLYRLEETAYSVATRIHCFSEEAYMPVSDEPRRWFTHAFIESISDVMTRQLDSFMRRIELNERLDPPTRSPGDDDPPMVKLMPTEPVNLGNFVSHFDMPEAVYNQRHHDHDNYNIRSMVKFALLRGAYFIDGGVAGGVHGVYQLGVYVIVMTRFMLKEHTNPPDWKKDPWRVSFDSNDGASLGLIMNTIAEAIVNSQRPNLRPAVSAEPQDHRWSPKALEFQREGDSETTRLEWPYGIWGTDSAPGHRGNTINQGLSERASSITPTATGQTLSWIGTKSGIPSVSPHATSEPTSRAPVEQVLEPSPVPQSLPETGQVINVEEPDNDDLYADFPEASQTKREVIPNPFMKSTQPTTQTERHDATRPYTILTTTAELPVVTEHNRICSLSLEGGARPEQSEVHGLGLSIEPPPTNESRIGQSFTTSTPHQRGRGLVRDATSKSQTQDVPTQTRKRPPVKPVPSETTIGPSQSSQSKSGTDVPGRSSSGKRLASPVNLQSLGHGPRPQGNDPVAASMLGTFARSVSGQRGNRQSSVSRAAPANTTRQHLKRNVKRPHGSSEEEEIVKKKPEPKKSRSGSRHSHD